MSAANARREQQEGTCPRRKSLKQRIKDGEVVVALRPPITISQAELREGADEGPLRPGLHRRPAHPVQRRPARRHLRHRRGARAAGPVPDPAHPAHLPDRPLPRHGPERHPGARGRGARRRPTRPSPTPTTRRSASAVGAAPRASAGPGRQAPQPAGVRRVRGTSTSSLAVQIESIKAVESARALAVPGVDYLAFGPQRPDFDLERNPDYRFRTADDCTRYVGRAGAGQGHPAGHGDRHRARGARRSTSTWA